jgi:ABC transporter transmembrane region
MPSGSADRHEMPVGRFKLTVANRGPLNLPLPVLEKGLQRTGLRRAMQRCVRICSADGVGRKRTLAVPAEALRKQQPTKQKWLGPNHSLFLRIPGVVASFDIQTKNSEYSGCGSSWATMARPIAMIVATMPSMRSVDLSLAGLRLPAGSRATATWRPSSGSPWRRKSSAEAVARPGLPTRAQRGSSDGGDGGADMGADPREARAAGTAAVFRAERWRIALTYGVTLLENLFYLLYPWTIGLAIDGLLAGNGLCRLCRWS